MTNLTGVWTVPCAHCQLRHGPVGASNDYRDTVLRRYFCPKSDRTIFLFDDGRYFGECVKTPTDSLKRGFRHAIMKAQGMLKET